MHKVGFFSVIVSIQVVAISSVSLSLRPLRVACVSFRSPPCAKTRERKWLLAPSVDATIHLKALPKNLSGIRSIS